MPKSVSMWIISIFLLNAWKKVNEFLLIDNGSQLSVILNYSKNCGQLNATINIVKL